MRSPGDLASTGAPEQLRGRDHQLLEYCGQRDDRADSRPNSPEIHLPRAQRRPVVCVTVRTGLRSSQNGARVGSRSRPTVAAPRPSRRGAFARRIRTPLASSSSSTSVSGRARPSRGSPTKDGHQLRHAVAAAALRESAARMNGGAPSRSAIFGYAGSHWQVRLHAADVRARRRLGIDMAPEHDASSPEPKVGAAPSEPDFSLVLGGPLFQLLRRAHLSDDALTLLRKRVGVIALVAWLPLLVISVLQGKATKGSVAVPFLMDVELHVRFLVALPLLVIAEFLVHQRMRPVVQLFRDRNIVPQSEIARFRAIIDSAFRLRNSVVAEVLLLAVVYGVGIQIFWRHYIALNAETWYATPSASEPVLSVAGLWYGYVSLPIFQFLLCRWYFRVFIWARFLYRVSRLDLALVPTHPARL